MNEKVVNKFDAQRKGVIRRAVLPGVLAATIALVPSSVGANMWRWLERARTSVGEISGGATIGAIANRNSKLPSQIAGGVCGAGGAMAGKALGRAAGAICGPAAPLCSEIFSGIGSSAGGYGAGKLCGEAVKLFRKSSKNSR